MKTLKKRFKDKRAAQTAVELAIFGGVLLFVLGLLVRQAFNSNYAQNHSLRAMRLALSESFKSAHGLSGVFPPTGPEASGARNVASILFLEDRLTPGTGSKYGPMTRTPYVISGTGGLSQNFFLPTDCFTRDNWGCEDFNLPRFDVIINGQKFTFTLAGFGQVNNLHIRPGPPSSLDDWQDNCAGRRVWDRQANDWVNQTIGCSKVYIQIPNFVNNSSDRFCTGPDNVACNTRPPACNTCKNLPVNRRFDLDRDPMTTRSGSPTGTEVPANPTSIREEFAWQWYMIKAFSKERSRAVGFPNRTSNFMVRIPFDHECPWCQPHGEDITFNKRQNKRKNFVVDIDGDMREETIIEVVSNPNGVIQSLIYQDNQTGDLDFSFDDSSLGPKPGLKEDIVMYTQAGDGNFLRIEEGKLFSGDSNQYVRNIQKRDRVDLIERVFQLSNDTGHFCGNGTIAPNNLPAYWDVPVGQVNRRQNPFLEACNNCFSTANPRHIDLNCFEEGSNILYIRTRIEDLGGRKWITRIPEPVPR